MVSSWLEADSYPDKLIDAAAASGSQAPACPGGAFPPPPAIFVARPRMILPFFEPVHAAAAATVRSLLGAVPEGGRTLSRNGRNQYWRVAGTRPCPQRLGPVRCSHIGAKRADDDRVSALEERRMASVTGPRWLSRLRLFWASQRWLIRHIIMMTVAMTTMRAMKRIMNVVTVMPCTVTAQRRTAAPTVMAMVPASGNVRSRFLGARKQAVVGRANLQTWSAPAQRVQKRICVRAALPIATRSNGTGALS